MKEYREYRDVACQLFSSVRLSQRGPRSRVDDGGGAHFFAMVDIPKLLTFLCRSYEVEGGGGVASGVQWLIIDISCRG